MHQFFLTIFVSNYIKTIKMKETSNWYNSQVYYHEEDENGVMQKKTNQLLIDAVSYTEAEARALEITSEHVNKAITIEKVTKTSITRVVVFSEEQREEMISDSIFYQGKFQWSSIDDGGRDRVNKETVIVEAPTFCSAMNILEEDIKELSHDAKIIDLKETKIISTHESRN